MRFVVHVFGFLLLLGLLATAGGFFLLHSPGPLTESKRVFFARGTGAEEMAEKLHSEGVILHALPFKAAAFLTQDYRKFKAGEYDFPAGISMVGAMGMLTRGDVVVHKFLLPEGLTVREVVERLMKEDTLTGEPDVSGIAEGSLLPETYHFVYGDSRASVLARMQESMKMVLAELWEKRAEGVPVSTPEEALTLASIIEKETSRKDERKRVAGVYVNRLKLGMKLQADPTVAYGIEKANGPMTRELILSDLEFDSPYNTYKYAGLPPGPIANPGRESIEAALNPMQTNELYFVADGKGGHNFAVTLKEHNNNVAAYRRGR